MAGVANGIGILANGALGAIFGRQQQKWLQNTLMQIYNNSQAANQLGVNLGLSPYNSALNAGNNLINLGTQYSFGAPGSDSGGEFTNYSDRINTLLSGLNPGQFQGLNGMSDATSGANDSLNGIAFNNQPMLDYLNGIVQNGGQTDQSSQLADRLAQIMYGQGYQMDTLANRGAGLMNNGGNTDLTSGLQNNALSTLANGGLTPGLGAANTSALSLIANSGSTPAINSGLGSALGILGKGGQTSQLEGLNGFGNTILAGRGLTPWTQAGQNTALSGFQNGGATPFTQGMQALGSRLAGQNPVLPTSLVAGMARDQASKNMVDAAENVRAQAVSRGGGPGSVVANGATNQTLADFGNQAAANVNNAVQNAILQQEGAGLQEQGLGANMGLGGAGVQASQLGTYGGDLANLAGVSNQLFGLGGNLALGAQGIASENQGQGFGALGNLSSTQLNALLSATGLLPTIQNSATGLEGTAGQLGIGGGNLALNNMSEGGNLLNMFNNTSLAGANAFGNLLGQQNQYALGAGNLANSGLGLQGNILQNVVGNLLSGNQLGLQGQNSYYSNALLPLLGQNANASQLGLGLINSGMAPMNNLFSTSMGYAGGALGMQPGLFNQYGSTQNPMAGLFNTLLGAGLKNASNNNG